MIDSFALLGQERRPWLDADALKNAFHRRSAELHPDVPGTGDAQRFAELNAAFTALRAPASRLRHLLELVAPAALAADAPPFELGDLFMRLGTLRRRLDDFLAREKAAVAPLARALLAGEEAELRRAFTALQAELASALSAAEAELRVLDAHWTGVETAACARLYQRFAYLTRWQAQAREAALRWE